MISRFALHWGPIRGNLAPAMRDRQGAENLSAVVRQGWRDDRMRHARPSAFGMSRRRRRNALISLIAPCGIDVAPEGRL